MVDRTRRELNDDDIAKITDAYHRWRGDQGAEAYEDVGGFCKAATLEEIRSHNHVLTPGRYVGSADVEDDEVPFAERFAKLKAVLEEQFSMSSRQNAGIVAALARID